MILPNPGPPQAAVVVPGPAINTLAAVAAALSARGGGSIFVGPTHGVLTANHMIILNGLANVTIEFSSGFQYQVPDSHTALPEWPVLPDSGGVNNRYPLFLVTNCTNCKFLGGTFSAANPSGGNNYRGCWMEGGNNFDIEFGNASFNGFPGWGHQINGYSLASGVAGAVAVTGPYYDVRIHDNIYSFMGKAGNDGGSIRISNATQFGNPCGKVDVRDNKHYAAQMFAIDVASAGAFGGTGVIDGIRIGGYEFIQMMNNGAVGNCLNFEAVGTHLVAAPYGIGIRNVVVEETVHGIGGNAGISVSGGYSGMKLGGTWEFMQGNGIQVGAGGGNVAGGAAGPLVVEDLLIDHAVCRNNNQAFGTAAPGNNGIQIGTPNAAANIGTIRRAKVGENVACSDTQGYFGQNGTSAAPVSGHTYPVADAATLSIAAGTTQTITIIDEFGNTIINAAATVTNQVMLSGWTISVTYAAIGAITCTFGGNTNNTPWAFFPTMTTGTAAAGCLTTPVSGALYFVAAPMTIVLGAGTTQTLTYYPPNGSTQTFSSTPGIQVLPGGYISFTFAALGALTVTDTFSGSAITNPFNPGFPSQRIGLYVFNGSTTSANQDVEVLCDANRFVGNTNNPILIGTVANGGRVVVKSPTKQSLTGKTAANPSVVNYQPPAAGWFLVGIELDVTAETGAVNGTVTYTDVLGNSRTITVATITGVGAISGTVMIYAAAANIVVKTTLGATATYSVNASIQQVG